MDAAGASNMVWWDDIDDMYALGLLHREPAGPAINRELLAGLPDVSSSPWERSINPLGRLKCCVVGYGRAGTIHARILRTAGFDVFVVDPRAVSGFVAPSADGVSAAFDAIARTRFRPDLWVIATPTHLHLHTLESILSRDLGSRVILEKPACLPDELDRLEAMVASSARIVVNDPYRYSNCVATLRDAGVTAGCRADAPGRIAIEFSKDRRPDVSAGRFVDQDYGLFGYEWLHMVAVLETILGSRAYGASDIGGSSVRIYRSESGVPVGVEEQLVIGDVDVCLRASTVGPVGLWQRGEPDHPSRRDAIYRFVQRDWEAEKRSATIEFDYLDTDLWRPFSHRTRTFRGGHLAAEETIVDRHFDRGVLRLVDAVMNDERVPIDFRVLRRISALARSSGMAAKSCI